MGRITIEISATTFAVRDLLLELEKQNGLPGSTEATLFAPEKEGDRPFFQELLELVFSDDMAMEVLKHIVTSSLSLSAKTLKDQAFVHPHIVITYNNGEKKKILYKGKRDSEIVSELLHEVSLDDIRRIAFKS